MLFITILNQEVELDNQRSFAIHAVKIARRLVTRRFLLNVVILIGMFHKRRIRITDVPFYASSSIALL